MAATGAMMRAKIYSAGMAPAFLPPIPHSGATNEVVTQWRNLTLASYLASTDQTGFDCAP